ncbi:TIM barrel protein [Arcicella rigui]|uniref:TIM barrel protein n=1 Tax=Arcicella rigui TaxID=797020 RepID=A0ABU5QFP1_9BACT|nr:TIM barrel protein [Arcicella rigui]MEA5141099.1 TIM barrel protein [Arcicella rigui]
MTNRRDFLKTIGVASAGAMLAQSDLFAKQLMAKPKQIGLQLYTLREELAKDAKGTISKVAQIGFNHVETFFNYSGDASKDLFWGMKPAELKQVFADNNLKSYSGHYQLNDYLTPNNGKDDALKTQIDIVATLGQKYLIVPVPPFGLIDKMTIDDYKFMAEQFNKAGELAHKSGVQLGYHNHFWEFKHLQGEKSGLDVLLEETQKDLLSFELDLFWTVKAGKDPVELFKKHPKRFVMWHVKDIDKQFAKAVYPAAAQQGIFTTLREVKFTEVGTGAVNFKEIFNHTQDLQNIFVEQDQIYRDDKFESVKMSYDYIKNNLI